MSILADQLAAARRAAGLTQLQLATKAGVGRGLFGVPQLTLQTHKWTSSINIQGAWARALLRLEEPGLVDKLTSALTTLCRPTAA